MSTEHAWAENLSKESIEGFMSVADGHTLFKPEAFLDLGIPEEVVKQHTKTHYSVKRPSYEATEALTDAIRVVLTEYVKNDGWMKSELVNDLMSEDDPGMANQLANDLLYKLVEADVHEISGYHPKEVIFDDSGNIVESMDAVYGLELARSMVDSLGLTYDHKMGRGFQYTSYCKALREYLENK